MEYDEILDFFKAFQQTKGKNLELSNKDISIVPDEIENLTQVEAIDLSFNNIEILPPAIFKLKSLKTLILTRNLICEIPPEIALLQKLETLDMSCNKLERIPPEFGKLKNLVTFDAGFNRLTELPLEITDLPNLKKLFLEDNPFEFPPEDVIQRGLYAIMIYLAHIKKKRDTTRVFIQIFNMPENVRNLFEQHLGIFQTQVACGTDLEYRIKFDINYIDNEGISSLKKS